MSALPPHCRRALVLVVGAAAVLAAFSGGFAERASAQTETTVFNINGRGWGHGIGMSQYGAYGYATHGWSYKSILRHYYTGVTFGRTSNRTVRVSLTSGQTSVRLTSPGSFTVADGTRTVTVPAGVVATVTWSGSAYRVSAGGRSWSFTRPITFKRGGRLLRLYNRNENGWPGGTSGARYRGNLRVIRAGSTLQVVNHVRLEDYLRGVVPREVPSSWPREALRAQAVAARSYAVRGIKSGGLYDHRCTAASQVYNGYDGEAAATSAAVAHTAGVVPVYGGRPIVAYFFSTSGGRTENIENVWGGSPVGYLKSVSDPYDTYSRYHRWPDRPLRYSQAAMAKKLGGLVPGTLRALYVTKRGQSPRVVSAAVIGRQGSTAHAATAVSGWTLRSRLGLRDTWFYVRSMSVSPTNSDRVTITYGDRYTLSGRTYPRIGAGKLVKLNYYRDGRWRTTNVAATRTVTRSFAFTVGGSVRYGKYTRYAYSIRPPRTTSYTFSYGSSRSAKVTVRVRPVISLAANTSATSAGNPVVFSGVVRPLNRAGASVQLQRLEAGAWREVGKGTVADDGTYAIRWVATSGSGTFRARIAAGDQMLGNVSPTKTVEVR